MESEKKFSKEKWLAAANSQRDEGYLSEKEIADACELWADGFDGKTKAEIGEDAQFLNDAWFV